jgi:hypothetical protein
MTATATTSRAEAALLRVKTANSDKEFEQALADLAYTQLSSRAPKLFRYAVAFQVVDQADDGDRAVGVFVFRAGDSWYQVPVFYKDGELRGTEILILGDDDYFPLTEESVNFFLENRSAGRAGKPISKQLSARYTAPSLWQLNTPPTKWSSARELGLPPEALNLRGLARAVKGACPEVGGLPTLLAEAEKSPKLAAALGRLIARAPIFAEKLAAVLDLAGLARAAQRHKAAAAAPPAPAILRTGRRKAAAERTTGLTVIRVTQTTLEQVPVIAGAGLDTATREKLKGGKNVYKDGRPDDWVTHVVDWGVVSAPGVATTPGAGADVYQVSTAGGPPERCLVASAPADPTVGNVEDEALVLRLSDNAVAVVPRQDVWVTGHEPDGLREWAADLPEAGEPDDLPARFVLVSPRGQVTRPLVRLGPVNGMTGVEVGGYACEFGPPGWAGLATRTFYPGAPPWDEGGFRSTQHDHGEERLRRREMARPRRVARTNAPAGDFVVTGNCLYYPDGTRVVSIPARHKPIRLGGWSAGEDPSVVRERDKKAQAPGGGRLSASPTRGGGFVLESRRAGASPVVKRAGCYADAEADLVEAFGLRPADAARLLGLAAETPAEVVVKFAAPTPPLMADRGAEAPTFPFDFGQQGAGFADDVVPTGFQGEAQVGVDSTYPTSSDWERYRQHPFDHALEVNPMRIGNEPPPGPESDPQLMQMLATAAQSGQKDVAEVGTLAALVKYTDVDDSLARLLGPMRKFVSRLGATLINGYANPDAYEERYGRMESVDLIDRLRGQFVGLGELYLSLREKASDRVVATSSVLPDLDISAQGQTAE